MNREINREIINNTYDEIDKDTMYREKAKQFFLSTLELEKILYVKET